MKKVENLRDSSKLDPLIFSAFFSLLRKPAEQVPLTAALLCGCAARALMRLDRTSCLDSEAGYAYSLLQILRRPKEWFSRELEGGF